MGLAFNNPMHDEFGTWPVAYIPYGGADMGEILAVGQAVGDGDDSAFHEAWMAAGDRLMDEAVQTQRRGRHASAKDLFLRASVFYSASYHPLYGPQRDPRLLAAFRKQIDAFDQGLALSDVPVAPMRIPFEGTTMPAYLIPAVGREQETRPLVIFTNGYDGTVTDLYFASAVAASRRGYHCLIFDGPGQGEMLVEQRIYLRPDWETVIAAVVDVALGLNIVDPKRIVLSGWSLGGYLAPRAASQEHRLAACIADPGLWGMPGPFRALALKLGASPDTVADLGNLDDKILAQFEQVISNDPGLKWKIYQRGFWTHGVDNLRDFLRSAEPFTMDGRAAAISCPVLMTLAEHDGLAAGAQAFFDQLQSPTKTLLRFSAAEGAGMHCEMRNRSLLNRRVFDWLDDVLFH